MYSLKIERTAEGLHSSELEVAVTTTDGGQEHLYVSRLSLADNGLAIGYPVGRDGTSLLVELPRETHNGAWRVWVPETSVVAK